MILSACLSSRRDLSSDLVDHGCNSAHLEKSVHICCRTLKYLTKVNNALGICARFPSAVIMEVGGRRVNVSVEDSGDKHVLISGPQCVWLRTTVVLPG